MNVKSAQKDNIIQFMEDIIGIPDSKIVEEMIRLDFKQNIERRKKRQDYE